MVILNILMVFASPIWLPLIVRLRLVSLLERFLNNMYMVLAGYILTLGLSHQNMSLLSDSWTLFCFN